MNLTVHSLSRSFGTVRAVDQVSFTLAPGVVCGFVGPNGAGKTTTMRILATLDEPDGGDARLDGISILEYPEEARRAIGFMPDTLPRHSDITAHEYIDFFARAHGLRGMPLHKAVADVEEFTGLCLLRGKTLASLSKGMRQRVSLARALVHDPKVLILDEPAAGLDPRARIELRELVRALAEAGKTLLISSHILSELAEICSDVIVIDRGRILRSGALRGGEPETGAVRTLAFRPLGAGDALRQLLLEMPWVCRVRPVAGEVHADIEGGEEEVAELIRMVVSRGGRFTAVYPVEENLETLFMRLTRGGPS